MGDDCITEPRIGEARQHGRLHRDHDLIGMGPDHRKAENAIVISGYDNLHEALRLLRRLCPQYTAHWKRRHAHDDVLPLRITLAQPDAGKRRVRKHAVGHQSVARAAVPARQIVPDDAIVIYRNMRELRASRTFTNRPDVRRSSLQSIVHANVAAGVQLDADFVEADATRVRQASCSDQQMTALDLPLVEAHAHGHADTFTRSALYVKGLRLDEESDGFVSEKLLHLIGDVAVLATQDLRAGLDDGHAATEAAIGLSHFQADVAAA